MPDTPKPQPVPEYYTSWQHLQAYNQEAFGAQHGPIAMLSHGEVVWLSREHIAEQVDLETQAQ